MESLLIVGFFYWSYDKKMVRFARYAIVVLIDFGLFPMLFKFGKI